MESVREAASNIVKVLQLRFGIKSSVPPAPPVLEMPTVPAAVAFKAPPYGYNSPRMEVPKSMRVAMAARPKPPPPSLGFCADTIPIVPRQATPKAEAVQGLPSHQVNFSTERDLDLALQTSEAEALQKEQSDLQEALLRSKAEGLSPDVVILARLTFHSPELISALVSSEDLQSCVAGVQDAGCCIRPNWVGSSNGAADQ